LRNKQFFFQGQISKNKNGYMQVVLSHDATFSKKGNSTFGICHIWKAARNGNILLNTEYYHGAFLGIFFLLCMSPDYHVTMGKSAVIDIKMEHVLLTGQH
jgi:hypothetical protein